MSHKNLKADMIRQLGMATSQESDILSYKLSGKYWPGFDIRPIFIAAFCAASAGTLGGGIVFDSAGEVIIKIAPIR